MTDLDKKVSEFLPFVNGEVHLISLLYDNNLLPEQLKSDGDKDLFLIVVGSYKLGKLVG